MTPQLKAMFASYGRSVLGAAAALYLSGVTDPLDLVWALVAAVIPVGLRAINPKDKAFGRVPNVQIVEEALKTANVEDGKKLAKAVAEKATPAKKPAAKKTTPKK
jgi:hypothetical protein